MIITPAPLLSGCVINCRPVGILKMIDEAGPDPKLLAVPMPRLTPFYNHVSDYRDLQPDKLAKITHFFQHYKDLEEGNGSAWMVGAVWKTPGRKSWPAWSATNSRIVAAVSRNRRPARGNIRFLFDGQFGLQRFRRHWMRWFW